ncbi:MAG: glycosyltransferase 87 family protein [Candidatus Hodarchaeales archaeon]
MQFSEFNHKNWRLKSRITLSGLYSTELILILTGFILLISFQILIVSTNLVRSSLFFEFLFFLPFFSYLGAIFLIKKRNNSELRNNQSLIIVVFAVFYQIILLLTNVTLSDDLFRFYYEAKAIVNGINPYYTSIDSFPIALRDQFFDNVNNPDVTSPYPPFALLIFTALYLVLKDPLIYRLIFSMSFITSIIVIYRIIPIKDRWKLIIYAWNPLLHLETANGSHFDPLVVLIVLLAIWALKSDKPVLAGFLFLLAFLTKFYPILLLSAFYKQLGKRGLIVFFIGFSAYVSLILLNLIGIQGLLTYVDEWYFNASMFWLLFELTKDFILSKIIVGGVFLSILFIVTLKSQNDLNTSYRHAFIIIGSLLLLQPVFHPWYIFWLFPFLLLEEKMKLSWIILSGTLIFSYHVYRLFDSLGIWVESNLFRVIEYLPFYFIQIFEILVTNIKSFFPLKFNRPSDQSILPSYKR